MAVKAPALLAGMVEHCGNLDVLVLQHPSFRVDIHVRMAVGAGEDSLGKGGGRYEEFRRTVAFPVLFGRIAACGGTAG